MVDIKGSQKKVEFSQYTIFNKVLDIKKRILLIWTKTKIKLDRINL